MKGEDSRCALQKTNRGVQGPPFGKDGLEKIELGTKRIGEAQNGKEKGDNESAIRSFPRKGWRKCKTTYDTNAWT